MKALQTIWQERGNRPFFARSASGYIKVIGMSRTGFRALHFAKGVEHTSARIVEVSGRIHAEWVCHTRVPADFREAVIQ